MRPTYPTDEFVIEPPEETSTVEMFSSPSGRIRTYDLGRFSDGIQVIRHVAVRKPRVEEIEEFWERNQGRSFNVISGLDDHWVAAFLAKPQRIHLGGPIYDVVVRLVIRHPAEGGL